MKALLSKGDGSDEAIDLRTWGSRRLAQDELLWIDVQSLDEGDLDVVRGAIRLSEDAAEALESEPGKPDARVLQDAVEVIVLSLDDDDTHDPASLRILMGDGWVITRHEVPMPSLDEHRARITDQREVGQLTPLEFLVSLLDWHVDSFFRAAEELEAEVDDLDDAALRRDDDLLQDLVAMRRRIAKVRRIVSVHREVFAEVMRPGFLTGLEEGESNALRHLADRLERAGEGVAHVREMLIGTFDVHMTRTAQRTNDTMKILTLASVILLPSVVVAGIMGMNFKVPIFENSSLFFVVVGFMAVMAVVTLLVARWRHWL
jgi:Mg2+ and Co2+ transporter CorA